MPLRQLWLSVMLARMPWLILAAWLGKGFLMGDILAKGPFDLGGNSPWLDAVKKDVKTLSDEISNSFFLV
ncbi:MAG: hypothetical protein R2865_10440 [Deinococcales bacterium]